MFYEKGFTKWILMNDWWHLKEKYKYNCILNLQKYVPFINHVSYPIFAEKYVLFAVIGPGPQAPCPYTTHMPNPITAKFYIRLSVGNNLVVIM